MSWAEDIENHIDNIEYYLFNNKEKEEINKTINNLKTNKTMKTATSKIKQVVNKKEFTNKYGTTIYHDLIMENGDKIQIGKKKEQLVGWELSYRIENEGAGESGEYKKASSIKPEEVEGGSGFATSQNISNKAYGDNDQRQRMIIAQSSLSSAVEFYKGSTLDTDDLLVCAKKFYDWVIKTAN